MNAYRPQPTEHGFILLDVLGAPQALAALPTMAEHADADLLRQVLDEAGKFVGEVVAPLSREGDEVGARWNAGAVTMPPGFRDAYQAFWQVGWPSLACATEDGGQGLPSALEAVLYEMLSAANHGWTMAPGLLHGAYECLRHHASPELKARYLPKVASGEWLATMCLTEPQAGSDLGLVRTRAVPMADGRFALSGTKIFISGGEHDLTDNIIHLVLARLPDSPPGPRGLSLFLVPKFYPDGDGDGHRAGPPQARPTAEGLRAAPAGLPAQGRTARRDAASGSVSSSEPPAYRATARSGEVGSVGAWVRSAVHCERIEEKMGLHGSPTCVMRFDDAAAWIVGEPGKGLNAMFVMMNAARLHVALQGIGLLDAAWQKADTYSKERRQMRAPGPSCGTTPAPAGSAVLADRAAARSGEVASVEASLIAEHPAMRRILDTQRAWVDGGRVLAYRTALELDLLKHHPDAQRRDAAQRWCSLVTPVLKAAFTHQAFYGASECLQVLGGHGYVREWGIEQIVRDARVAMIYEGTNEIQAIDLLVRKVLPDGGANLGRMLDELALDLEPGRASHARVRAQLAAVGVLTRELTDAAAADNTLAFRVADDYLRAVAVTLLGWAWSRIEAALAPDTPERATRWQAPAQALRHWVQPEFDMRLAIVRDHCAAGHAAAPVATAC